MAVEFRTTYREVAHKDPSKVIVLEHTTVTDDSLVDQWLPIRLDRGGSRYVVATREFMDNAVDPLMTVADLMRGR